MYSEGDDLFGTYDLRLVIEAHRTEMQKELNSIKADQLLNTSVEDLAQYLVEKYALDVPRLSEDETSVDQQDTQVDVSGDFMRAAMDRSRPAYVPGTAVNFFVPFTGDPDLFKCRPSTFSIAGAPRGVVEESVLILAYTTTNHDHSVVKGQFNSDMASIRKYLQYAQNDVRSFNDALQDAARAAIEARRQKLLNDQGLASALGFPLRPRPDAPTTFVAPSVRRKVPVRPEASVKPFVSEPMLDMKEYDYILSVVRNMVMVMERSPQAFRSMVEEDLREHFLVQLNGHYEGQATGETFNYEGKTDILIRVEDRNIFIGECKFWKGQQALTKAMDQLLGYATWRDTKTALFVFNRRKNFSAVVEQIPAVVRSHPNFKRRLPYDVETGFRCLLRHRDDPNRELILTTLAFDVPT